MRDSLSPSNERDLFPVFLTGSPKIKIEENRKIINSWKISGCTAKYTGILWLILAPLEFNFLAPRHQAAKKNNTWPTVPIIFWRLRAFALISTFQNENVFRNSFDFTPVFPLGHPK
ncbi:MAG: hypothetical protein KBF32_09445 [Chitinophagales bacterium]|nr:hypothetical protein [Chitinophagales bacterium]